MTSIFLAALLSALFAPFVLAQPLLFADAHLHYNWDQPEVTSAHFSPGGPGFLVNVAMFKALASFLSTILFAGCPIRLLAHSRFAP